MINSFVLRRLIFVLCLCSIVFCVSNALDTTPKTQNTTESKEQDDYENFNKAMFFSYIPYFELLKVNMKVSSKDFYVACGSALLTPVSSQYVKSLTKQVQQICKGISKLDAKQFKKIANDIKLKNEDAYMESFELYAYEIQEINKKFADTQKLVDKCLQEKKRKFLDGRIRQEACFADDKLENEIKKYHMAHKKTKAQIRNVYYSMLLSFMGVEAVKNIKSEKQYMAFYNYFIGILSSKFAFIPSSVKL